MRAGIRSFRGSRYDATVRNIEVVGEAATHVPESVRRDHPEIPWRMVIATSNQLIHGYVGIDDDVLWSIVRTDIPTLLASMRIFENSGAGLMRCACIWRHNEQ